jgi:serine/threonine-protein kinase ATR
MKEGSQGRTKNMSLTVANMAFLVCKQYGKGLVYSTKYLYQTLPRMLTVWLDLGANVMKLDPQIDGHAEIEKISEKARQANNVMLKLLERLPAYHFLTAVPQLVSRICHPNPTVHSTIESMIVAVLVVYPQQTLWNLVAVAKSTLSERAQRINQIFKRIQADISSRRTDPNLIERIRFVGSLTDHLIHLCNFQVAKDVSVLNMSRDFRKLQKLVATVNPGVIIPLQKSLTANMPSVSNTTHKPFLSDLPIINGPMFLIQDLKNK